jgi:hypothetical protein
MKHARCRNHCQTLDQHAEIGCDKKRNGYSHLVIEDISYVRRNEPGSSELLEVFGQRYDGKSLPMISEQQLGSVTISSREHR